MKKFKNIMASLLLISAFAATPFNVSAGPANDVQGAIKVLGMGISVDQIHQLVEITLLSREISALLETVKDIQESAELLNKVETLKANMNELLSLFDLAPEIAVMVINHYLGNTDPNVVSPLVSLVETETDDRSDKLEENAKNIALLKSLASELDTMGGSLVKELPKKKIKQYKRQHPEWKKYPGGLFA